MNAEVRVRFATVRDLYAAFSTAPAEVGEDATDEASLAFVRRLLGEDNARAAISYCAYLLARREAVWWAHSCVLQIENQAPNEMKCLAAAEAWVRAPDENRRRAALELGTQSNSKLPATWVALAAGWTGGNMNVSSDHVMPPPPHLTAQAVRGALLMAPPRLTPARREGAAKAWVEAAMRYAVGDFGRS